MSHLLKDQTALVTGGTAGIGKAIALRFAEAGARVAIFGTNAERGQQVLDEIMRLNPDQPGIFIAVNVVDTQAIEHAVKNVLAAFGRVDILVNNAGITRDQLLMKMSESDWDEVMGVNVKSCYNLTHALVRSMMKNRRGKIINISSVVGIQGNAGQANYAASKAAMIGFTKALAVELAPRNICVNCIAPGFIETPMTEALTEQQRADALQGVPLGRLGSALEIANATLFLASRQADYITGQVLAVDGGMTSTL
jgi:3-oxoacyl-[acyl-carrier protein] reductase